MTSDEFLKQGIAAYKAGQRAEAHEFFLQSLKLDQRNEQAWLWLSSVVDTDAERRTCLEEVLALNPTNAAAKRGLEHLQAPESEPPATVELQPLPRSEPISGSEQSEPPATVELQPLPRSEPISRPELPVPIPLGPDRPPVVLEDQVADVGEKGDRSDMSWWMVAGAILVVVCLVACVLVVLLGSFEGQGSASPTDSPGIITSVVYENIAAHNAEDVERYMATLHSQAPNYDQTRETLVDMYRNYDIKHTLTGVELLKASKTRAEVSFTLTTQKVRGPSFRDNRVVGVFILRKEDGRWKLYDQEVDDIEYLK